MDIRAFILKTRKAHPRFWAASKTSAAAAAAVLTPELFIYIGDVAEWSQADTGGFPAPDHLGRTAIYAVVVFLAGLYNYVWNTIKGNKIEYKVEEK